MASACRAHPNAGAAGLRRATPTRSGARRSLVRTLAAPARARGRASRAISAAGVMAAFKPAATPGNGARPRRAATRRVSPARAPVSAHRAPRAARTRARCRRAAQMELGAKLWFATAKFAQPVAAQACARRTLRAAWTRTRWRAAAQTETGDKPALATTKRVPEAIVRAAVRRVRNVASQAAARRRRSVRVPGIGRMVPTAPARSALKEIARVIAAPERGAAIRPARRAIRLAVPTANGPQCKPVRIPECARATATARRRHRPCAARG